VSVVTVTFAKRVALGLTVGLGALVMCLALLITVVTVMSQLMMD
jgi:hypothetical protein